MSKSYGNYIGLTDEAADMFGKVMSIPDELMVKYYRLASTEAVDEIDRIEAGVGGGGAESHKGPLSGKRRWHSAGKPQHTYAGLKSYSKRTNFFFPTCNLKFKEHGFPADAPIFAPDLTPDENGLVYVAKILVDAGSSVSPM